MSEETDPPQPPVLIVSPDDHWLRILDVTIRTWGYGTITRRSVTDALRVRTGELAPRAIVFDPGAEWSPEDLDAVRAFVADAAVPAIVILPERLVAERDRIAAAGATLLVRPYRPSELQAILPPVAIEAPAAPAAPVRRLSPKRRTAP